MTARATSAAITYPATVEPKKGLHYGPICNNLFANTTAQQVTDALAAVTSGTVKTGHIVRADTIGNVRARYMNVSGDGTQYGGNPGITSMKAAIVLEAGTVIPLKVAGASSWPLAAGATVETDHIAPSVWVPRLGDRFYVLTYLSLPSNGGVQASFPWPALDQMTTEWTGHDTLGIKTGGDYTDGSGANTFSSQITGWGFGPVSILADLQETHRTVAVHGDSISTQNYGDALSWPLKPLNDAKSVPYVVGLHPGRATADARSTAALYASYGCSDVICELGANDTPGATRQTTWIATWTAHRTNGAQRVYQTTMTPRTDGSNVSTSSTSATLTDNAWLRDGAPILGGSATTTGNTANGVLRAGDSGHPLTDYIEVGNLFFKQDGSGLWDATYFSDGLHPNSAGYTLLNNVIDAAWFDGIDGRVVTKAIADWRTAQPPVLPVPSAGGATYHPNRTFSSQSQLTPVIQRCYMIPFVVQNQSRDIPTLIYCNRTGGSGTPSTVRAVIYRAKPVADSSGVLPWDLVADYGTTDLLLGNSWSRATNITQTRGLWPQILPDWLHWVGICFEVNSGTPMTILQGVAPTELQPGGAFSTNSGIAVTLPAGAAPAQLTNGASVGPIASAPYLLWGS